MHQSNEVDNYSEKPKETTEQVIAKGHLNWEQSDKKELTESCTRSKAFQLDICKGPGVNKDLTYLRKKKKGMLEVRVKVGKKNEAEESSRKAF